MPLLGRTKPGIYTIPQLAAFADADGCITIAWQKHPKHRSATSTLQFSIYQSNRSFLVDLQSVYGGVVELRNYKESRGAVRRTRDALSLRWLNDGAATLLLRLLPHMVIKQEQARIAYLFRSYQNETRPFAKKFGRSRLSVALLLAMRNEIMRLNQRDDNTPSYLTPRVEAHIQGVLARFQMRVYEGIFADAS